MYRRSSWDRGYDRDAGFEKLSLDDQERVCRSFAEHNGIEIVDVVTDQSISGGAQAFLKRKILPTIERVRDGEADGVLVWELSRWGRDANTSAISEVALMEAGGRLISATEPSDTSTMRGRLLRHVQRAFNQMTMEQAQKSWRLTHDRRRTNGLPADGRGRFGYVYRRDADGARYELDPEAAPILASCYRRASWPASPVEHRSGPPSQGRASAAGAPQAAGPDHVRRVAAGSRLRLRCGQDRHA